MLDVETMEPFLTQLADRIAAKMAEPVTVTTITFGELFDLYFEKHAKVKVRNLAFLSYFNRTHGNRWREIQVGAITRKAVQAWVEEVGTSSRSAANKCLHIMQAVINWGIRRDWLPSMKNPCSGVDKFPGISRERFAAPDELLRLSEALTLESSKLQDFFWLALLTGARRGNLLTMRWEEVDFELATWTIPYTKFKNGSFHTIPLSEEALIVLRRRHHLAEASAWVFPGRKPGERIKCVKRAWERITKRANLKDLRIHDLRRTIASHMAINGENQYVIARMLGHKDMRSTAVYARLDLASVRKANQVVSNQWHQMVVDQTRATRLSKVAPINLLTSNVFNGAQPKNADVVLSPVEQIIVESKIITCINSGHGFKKAFYRKVGSHVQINSRELERILSEMIDRQLIDCYEDDKGTWRYALSNSGARAS